MARTKAISLIQTGSTKVDLAELSGLVISNIQKETLSSGLKSQSYTGNPATGSVEYKRFKNSASQAYGTARAAGKGDAITVPPTTVNLDTHREIVEEAAKFDLDTFAVGNIMARRADNHVDTVAAELDAAFFAKAKEEGTSFTTQETDIEAQVEALILLEFEVARVAVVKFLGDEQLLGGDGLGGHLPAQPAQVGQPVVVGADVLHLRRGGDGPPPQGGEKGGGHHRAAAQGRDPPGQQPSLWYPCGDDDHAINPSHGFSEKDMNPFPAI